MQTRGQLAARHPAFQPEPSKLLTRTRPGRRQRLGELALFDSLPADVVRSLETFAQTRAIEKGGFVFLPGDLPESVYFLVSGSVKVSRLTDEGKELILELVTPGGSFGESGVFDASPRETAAEALERSVLLSVPSNGLRHFLTTNPSALMKFTEYLGDRRKQLEKRLVDAVHKKARQRLADLLLQLGRGYGVRDARGTLLRINLSQTALGNLLGVSREIVNQAVSDLKRRGVIDVSQRRAIIIQDVEALAASAA